MHAGTASLDITLTRTAQGCTQHGRNARASALMSIFARFPSRRIRRRRSCADAPAHESTPLSSVGGPAVVTQIAEIAEKSLHLGVFERPTELCRGEESSVE